MSGGHRLCADCSGAKTEGIPMAGRKPKPTALKKLEGNPGKRKLNMKEPVPAKGMAEWDGYYHDVVHFFGHIHNNCNEAAEIMDKVPIAYNVGTDLLDFTPKTYEQIVENKT